MQMVKRRTLLSSAMVILTIVILLFICACSMSEGNSSSSSDNKSEEKLYEAYNYASCEYPWAEIGSDYSYIMIDTNPYDYDATKYRKDVVEKYLSVAVNAIQNINYKLGLPNSLMREMQNTNSMTGVQTRTFSSKGVEVSWSYHPNNGLEVIYKAI